MLQSTFLRNTIALLSGTAATQAIVFLASPILSRVFNLVDFGNLANYLAWVAMLSLLGNLRYEHAVLVAKGREKTGSVLALSAALSLGSLLLYSIGAACLYFFYEGTGYWAHLRSVVLFIPIGVFAVSLSSLLMQFNYKDGRFKRLAYVSAAQVAVTLALQIALGTLGIRHALIIGTIGGLLFSGGSFAVYFVREGWLSGVGDRISGEQLSYTAREFSKFPRYSLPADAITVLAQQFVPVFVLALFGPAVAGLYAFSVRVVRVPLIAVSTAVAGALRKESVDLVHEGRSLVGLFTATVRSLTLLAMLPFVVAVAFAPSLFVFVFGREWVGAGQVVRILSPGILCEFIALPMATFFLVTGTQRYTLVIQVAGLAALVVALFLGQHFFNDFTAACYLVSGVMIAVNVTSILLAARVVGVAEPIRVSAD